MPRQQSWKRWIARQLRDLALAYVAVLVVLLFLENKLIFRPVLASEDWLAPPRALVQDIELQSAAVHSALAKDQEHPSDAGSLAAALAACINDYLKRYPSTTWSMVRAALAAAGAAVEQAAAGAREE